jgi:ribonuclease BN (tRNA processing enzyme)
MDAQYFPVSLGEMAADIRVHEVRDMKFELPPFSITARYVNHPGVTLAYRVAIDGVSVVYATDCEPFTSLHVGPGDADPARAEWAAGADQAFVDFIRDADLYIADSQYSTKDYAVKRGWGHTAWPDAVKLALAGRVRRIALFSHDPMHDDAQIDEKVAECRAIVAEAGRASGDGALEVVPAVEGEALTVRSAVVRETA